MSLNLLDEDKIYSKIKNQTKIVPTSSFNDICDEYDRASFEKPNIFLLRIFFIMIQIKANEQALPVLPGPTQCEESTTTTNEVAAVLNRRQEDETWGPWCALGRCSSMSWLDIHLKN